MDRRPDRRTSRPHVRAEGLHLDPRVRERATRSTSRSSSTRRATRASPAPEHRCGGSARSGRTRPRPSRRAMSTATAGDDLFVSTWSPARRKSVAQLYRVQGGFAQDATERSGISLPQGAAFATFADYDNDGWLDLFAIGGEGRGHLFRNGGNGTFTDVTAKAGVADVKGARKGTLRRPRSRRRPGPAARRQRPAHRLPQQSRRHLHRGDGGLRPRRRR